jgi:hypothetical protein
MGFSDPVKELNFVIDCNLEQRNFTTFLRCQLGYNLKSLKAEPQKIWQSELRLVVIHIKKAQTILERKDNEEKPFCYCLDLTDCPLPYWCFML